MGGTLKTTLSLHYGVLGKSLGEKVTFSLSFEGWIGGRLGEEAAGAVMSVR